MNFFTLLLQQLTGLFSSQTSARKFFVFVVLVASMGGLGYLAMRARTGSFRPVIGDLEPSEAAAAANVIAALGIPTRFSQDGRTLQVSSRRYSQAIMVLASEGFLDRADEEIPGVIGQPKAVIDRMLHGMSERELARTITTLAAVSSARVHLALPPETVFVGADEGARPTASVLLRLRPGVRLNEKSVAGIAQLVAHAVPNLDSNDVSIMDHTGQVMNAILSDDAGVAAMSHLEYKREYEKGLKERIEVLIAKTVGEGKVVADVNADFIFTQTTQTAEIYDPNQKVPIREKTMTQGRGARTSSGGAPGSTANTAQGGAASSLSNASGPTTENVETDYAVSKTTTKTVDTVPELNRLSISILVDANTVTEAQRATIQQLAQSAVGFSDARGGSLGEDVITVERMPFAAGAVADLTLEPVEEPLIGPDLIREIIQWGVVGGIALLVVLTVLRPAVKSVTLVTAAESAPVGLPAPGEGELSDERPAGGELEEPEEPEEEPQPIKRKDVTSATRNNVPKAASVLHGWLDE